MTKPIADPTPELVNVTPAMCREWLKHNEGNRPLRRRYVAGLRESFMRGEYKLMHAGFAFDANGNILDGQHRMQAIAGMPDHFSFPMFIVRGLPSDSFTVMDQGVKRSHADILKIDKRLVEVGRFLYSLWLGNRKIISLVTPQRIGPVCEVIAPFHEALIAACKTVCGNISGPPSFPPVTGKN